MLRNLSRIAVAFFALPLPALRAVPSVPPQGVGCVGCQGSGGGQAQASGGSCGGTVQISVLMGSGECKWVQGDEWGEFDCKAIKGCKPTVTRSWSGLPANSALEFCITLSGQTLCLQNPPNAGSGSGSDVRNSADQPCETGASRTFTISSPGCGLSASTETNCSSCDGL